MNVRRDPVVLLACGLGSGYSPWMPGTVGTLIAVPIYLAAAHLALPLYLALVAALFAIGIPLCGRAAERLGADDPGCIVWDEVVGYLATMAAAPPGWIAPVAGFVLFRVFDIVKPWPIRTADRRLHGGFGIMLDDLLAAVYAWACLQGIGWLLAR